MPVFVGFTWCGCPGADVHPQLCQVCPVCTLRVLWGQHRSIHRRHPAAWLWGAPMRAHLFSLRIAVSGVELNSLNRENTQRPPPPTAAFSYVQDPKYCRKSEWLGVLDRFKIVSRAPMLGQPETIGFWKVTYSVGWFLHKPQEGCDIRVLTILGVCLFKVGPPQWVDFLLVSL